MNEVRLIDANVLKKSTINDFDNLQAYFPKDFIKEIDNAPTVKTYCYYCGQTEHGKISENDITDFYPKIIRSTKETSFDEYLKEQLKDPEFRKEWEKLSDEEVQND